MHEAIHSPIWALSPGQTSIFEQFARPLLCGARKLFANVAPKVRTRADQVQKASRLDKGAGAFASAIIKRNHPRAIGDVSMTIGNFVEDISANDCVAVPAQYHTVISVNGKQSLAGELPTYSLCKVANCWFEPGVSPNGCNVFRNSYVHVCISFGGAFFVGRDALVVNSYFWRKAA